MQLWSRFLWDGDRNKFHENLAIAGKQEALKRINTQDAIYEESNEQ